MLAEWWRHFFMPPHQLVVTGCKQTNQSMNWMIISCRWYSNFCVYTEVHVMRKIWYFSSKVYNHLSLYCAEVQTTTKISDGTRILVLLRVFWDMISKIYRQFWHSFLTNALESSYNFNPIGKTWRKMVQSVCLTPVLLVTWRLHTSWHFTVPAYSDLLTINITDLPSVGINYLYPNLQCGCYRYSIT